MTCFRPLSRAWLVPALLALAACGGPGGCGDRALERMVDQPKVEPYDRDTFFADGRGMRPLPDGAVPEERTLGPVELVEGKGADGKPVDRFPLPMTRALVERGRERFTIYCAVCHGTAADGDSVVGHNMESRPPPSLVDARVAAFPVGRLYQVVRGGYGYMPSYARQLSVEERWGVVAYVRALQRTQGVPMVQLPPTLRDEALHALQ